MKVLSLFDGCGLAYQALENLNIKVDTYYASEIDKWAIQVAMKNHPDIIQQGDVSTVSRFLKNVDLLIGGSPCQDLSIMNKKRKGLTGNKSGLVWKYVELLEELAPKYFLLENVSSMKEESKKEITAALGVSPIIIDSNLLTAQNRKRLYWTNIKGIEQPVDEYLALVDILEGEVAEEFYLNDKQQERVAYLKSSKKIKRNRGGFEYVYREGKVKFPKELIDKSHTLTSGSGQNKRQTTFVMGKGGIRKLTPIECERLQGLPDNYTEGVSNTQRYKMLGNGFTVPVIEHILSFADFSP